MHRDLKPENILIKSKENKLDVRIADLGLATKFKKNSLLFEKCGTPFYFAPEIFDKKGYTEKVDIFNIGVIMYNLLTGKQLFKGTTKEQIIK